MQPGGKGAERLLCMHVCGWPRVSLEWYAIVENIEGVDVRFLSCYLVLLPCSFYGRSMPPTIGAEESKPSRKAFATNIVTPPLDSLDKGIKTDGRRPSRPPQRLHMCTPCSKPCSNNGSICNTRRRSFASRRQGIDPSDIGPVLPREEILDRMDAHTKDCAACGKAMRGKLNRYEFGVFRWM